MGRTFVHPFFDWFPKGLSQKKTMYHSFLWSKFDHKEGPLRSLQMEFKPPPTNGLIHRFSWGETTVSRSLLIQLDPAGFPSVGNPWSLFRWLWARNHNSWGFNKNRAVFWLLYIGNFRDELDLLSTYTVHFSLWIIWWFSVGWLLWCLHPEFQRFSFFDQKGYIWWYVSFGFIGYPPVRWSKNHGKIKTTSAAEKPVICEMEMFRIQIGVDICNDIVDESGLS